MSDGPAGRREARSSTDVARPGARFTVGGGLYPPDPYFAKS